MRARVVKPQLFKNEDLARLPAEATILFIGLWCLADRDGRLEDRPLKIKAEVRPYSDCDCEPLLGLLHEHGFIVRYEAEGGRRIIQIVSWERHGRPHPNEPTLNLPAPSEDASKSCKEISLHGELRSSSSLSSSSFSSSLPPNPPSGGTRYEGEISEQGNGQEPTASEFVEAWNAVHGFRRCNGLKGKRLRAFKSRTRDREWVSTWRQALDRVSSSPFCLGNGERGWRATVDWFLREETVLRIQEGEFDAASAQSPFDKALAEHRKETS